jgi:hypothetical protein
VIKKVLNVCQELVYVHDDLGESYRRVVGALAWPVLGKPGFLVVLAEYWVFDQGLKARPLRILVSMEKATIQDLHQGCLELRKLCQAENWLADMTKKHEVRHFFQKNRELEMQRPLSLSAAPYTREGPRLGIYLQMITDMVQVGRKILIFGDQSGLSSYLMARSKEEMEKPASDYPPLAALGYAASEMLLREPWDPRRMAQPPVTTWNPMQWVEGR